LFDLLPALPLNNCFIIYSMTNLIVNAYSVTSGLILIFKMYDLVILFIIMRVNLRAMILRGSAGRVCHLENLKFYMSYLQQYTKIIKMKTYFS
jgi:hypothetical protein